MQSTEVVSVSDVRSISVDEDPVIQKERTEFHPCAGEEEALNESSSWSLSVQSFIKEETDCGEDEEECDTARLARRVKDALQRLNIGQRVFGHYVLGLSQGTVSDILARPKPWSKLTSRGREPFLRMKHFLSDERSIRTLGAIQETLRGVLVSWAAPERSSEDVIKKVLDQRRLQMLDINDDDDDDEGSRRDGDSSDDIIRSILQQARHETQTETARRGGEDSGTPEPSARSTADFVQSIIQKVKCELKEDPGPSAPPAGPGPEPQRPRSCPISSGSELHALCLDTLHITHRVKETLSTNNIGQRVFGEEVLGLTQSSVSELLSHPKPWKKLSLKGKENFIRMHLWLQDPQNIQKIKDKKKMDHRARLKRVLTGSGGSSQRWLDAGAQGFSDDRGRCEATKRPRVILSAPEREALLETYRTEPYPSQITVERLAARLGLNTSTVSNWFYNYRSRHRQDVLSAPGEPRTFPSPVVRSPVSAGVDRIKQEPSDGETEDTDLLGHVSVGVQSISRVKTEREEDLFS
ncbi:homeobox protein cut-like 2 [Puntigrus tetrazona]|uniref:homeobox protein cut-like 2 n=1 Tax=Puntigrus tetrazona TaxID=1606681 RepID=UPI001C88E7E2|nr:homeobox protein cut-like 2 [Puntigrus tetrazona]